MDATGRLVVTPGALPRSLGGRGGGLGVGLGGGEPGELSALCAAGAAGLGGLASAGALLELGAHLEQALAAVHRRFEAWDAAVGQAAVGYASLEAALARAAGAP